AIGDGVAQYLIFAAIARGTVARLAFETESDSRCGVVEVAQMFEVETLVAGGAELSGALKMGGHVVSFVRRIGHHPLQRFERLVVALGAGARAASRNQFLCSRIPAHIGSVRAAGDRAIPVV